MGVKATRRNATLDLWKGPGKLSRSRQGYQRRKKFRQEVCGLKTAACGVDFAKRESCVVGSQVQKSSKDFRSHHQLGESEWLKGAAALTAFDVSGRGEDPVCGRQLGLALFGYAVHNAPPGEIDRLTGDQGCPAGGKPRQLAAQNTCTKKDLYPKNPTWNWNRM